jgi:LysM repeat protein
MNSRVPVLRLGVWALSGLIVTASAPAQDDPLAEMASLKKVVEEQGRQIEALSAQVAQLAARLESKPADSPAAPAPMAEAPSAPSAPLVAVPLPQPELNVYLVGKGDSLEKIAKSYGMTTAELQKLNNITDPNKLRIGQKIVLPAGAAPKEPQ